MDNSTYLGLERNVGPTDRIISITAGTAMLVSHSKKEQGQTFISDIYVQGYNGHCLVYKHVLHTDTLEDH